MSRKKTSQHMVVGLFYYVWVNGDIRL